MKKYKINVMRWNLEKYNRTPLFYQKFQVLLLMENANTHLVSVFKDYLLYDDMTEFFKEFYKLNEIYPRLKTIYEYYESSSYLFPNYTVINEGKYIYRNIIKKQKLIDYLEDLEDKKKEKEEKKNKINNKGSQNSNDESSSYIEVFDTKVYDNIRKETENDSKINELFCVGTKTNNESDSFASIMKLTEMIKDKDKDKIKEKEKEKEKSFIKKENKINNSYLKKNIIINKDNNISNKNTNSNTNNNTNINTSHKNNNSINNNVSNNKYNITYKNKLIINKDFINSNINNYIINKNNNKDNNKDNSNKEININANNIQNRIEPKIYVSKRVKVNNKSSGNKKNVNKLENFNINNFINSNNTSSNLTSRIINHTSINRNKNIITDTSRSNDFIKNNSANINKKFISNTNSNKNSYKKNNIIINIINNNKNNNYNSNNTYIPNHINNNSNENKNNNNNNQLYINNNNYYSNSGNNNISENKINSYNYINNKTNNNSTKSNDIKINSNYIKKNNIMHNQISSKGLTVKNSISNNNKTIIKRTKKEIKSKLLSFKMTTDLLPTDQNLLKNLTDRLKNQSQSNSIKKSIEQSNIKNVLSPNKNMKKRTKTEILGAKSDVYLFGQQNDGINYNKSINRQILKGINLTNSSKPRKDISLVNKKIVKYHFNLNENSNNNLKSEIKNKYIKHFSTNSQNLTEIGKINKIRNLQIRDITQKKGGVFAFNKTERTSRNHSKDKINKIINTTVKMNCKDSFSLKKSQELILNKIHRIQNKNNNAIISSFIKSASSNKKIKNLKNNKKNENSNIKSVIIYPNNKDLYSKINKDKNLYN